MRSRRRKPFAALRENRRDAQNGAMPNAAPQPSRFARGFLTDIWYFAALTSDLKPGRLARQMILGEPVLLGRSPGGEVFALRDICPHRAAPLSAGQFAREADGAQSVECPYHGWRFRADGRCAAVPSLVEGQAFDLDRVRVRRYPTCESQGLVFIWMASDPRATAGPDHAAPTFPGVVGGSIAIHTRVSYASGPVTICCSSSATARQT